MEKQKSSILFSDPKSKKWLVILLVLLCVAVSFFGVIDKQTNKYVTSATEHALYAYAGARAINAGISVAQSTEFGAGIGFDARLQPFQILDPLNDLVEDYSTAMKYAIGSLLAQKVLIQILDTIAFKVLVLVAGALLILSILFFNGLYATALLKVFLFVTFVRFIFVLTIMFSGLIDNAFLEKKTKDELAVVEQTKVAVEEIENMASKNPNIKPEEIDNINKSIENLKGDEKEFQSKIDAKMKEVAAANIEVEKTQIEIEKLNEGKGTFEKMKDTINILNQDEQQEKAKNSFKVAKEKFDKSQDDLNDLNEEIAGTRKNLDDLRAKLKGEEGWFSKAKSKLSEMGQVLDFRLLKDRVEKAVNSILMLISLFILKTLVIPILFLFLLVKAFKSLWGIDLRELFAEKNPFQKKQAPVEES